MEDWQIEILKQEHAEEEVNRELWEEEQIRRRNHPWGCFCVECDG